MTTPRPRDTRTKGVTQAMVAAAAADVLREQGIDKLSMRQVALRLGVTPMALYNHVQSKEDLLRVLADHLRDQVVVDEALAPREQLLSLLTQLRDLGAEHPALLGGPGSLGASRQAAQLALLQLRLLRELGLTPVQVRTAYQGLVLLVAGAALAWRARVHEPDATGHLRALVRDLASAQDLLLLEELDALPAQTAEEAFALAVDRVIASARSV